MPAEREKKRRTSSVCFFNKNKSTREKLILLVCLLKNFPPHPTFFFLFIYLSKTNSLTTVAMGWWGEGSSASHRFTLVPFSLLSAISGTQLAQAHKTREKNSDEKSFCLFSGSGLICMQFNLWNTSFWASFGCIRGKTPVANELFIRALAYVVKPV